MGLHGGEWRIHASAVDESKVIADALRWLSGDGTEVDVQKENSTLGAPMQRISVRMNGRQALMSLGRLEKKSLRTIQKNGLDERIDDDKFLHIRLNLGLLVQGIGSISSTKNAPVAKGKFKLEVYPGQEPKDVAEKFLNQLIDE